MSSPRRPLVGLAVMLTGTAALWALVVLLRRIPVDLAPISGAELRALLRHLPETVIPAAALRHIEALLVPLMAGAAVLVIAAGAAIAVRRARIVRRLHVFGRRVG